MAINFSVHDEFTHSVTPASEVPDESDDVPRSQLPRLATGGPPLVFGAATLSTIYNTSEHLGSSIPLRTVRLALRYGINQFDTSPYYGNSEIVLGSLLRALSQEYPRSSYLLSSKCGRYGPNKADFDYSPTAIRQSLQRTLRRLGTDYLDVFFLHDVEFVATRTPGSSNVNSADALRDDEARYAWGLDAQSAGKVWDDGDQKILDAYGELRKLKEEGLVRAIGISGYPLPVLLRLALLIKIHFKEPVDAMMTYSHHNLQNHSLPSFLPSFTREASIKLIYNASPLNMGLLAPSPPKWHPAPAGMLEAQRRVVETVQSDEWPGGLPDLALGFALRRNARPGANQDNPDESADVLPPEIPSVIGLSKLEEVHDAVRVWQEVNASESSDAGERRLTLERRAMGVFEEAGWSNWSWDSGV